MLELYLIFCFFDVIIYGSVWVFCVFGVFFTVSIWKYDWWNVLYVTGHYNYNIMIQLQLCDYITLTVQLTIYTPEVHPSLVQKLFHRQQKNRVIPWTPFCLPMISCMLDSGLTVIWMVHIQQAVNVHCTASSVLSTIQTHRQPFPWTRLTPDFLALRDIMQPTNFMCP